MQTLTDVDAYRHPAFKTRASPETWPHGKPINPVSSELCTRRKYTAFLGFVLWKKWELICLLNSIKELTVLLSLL